MPSMDGLRANYGGMHDCNLQYNVVGNMNCCEGTVMFQKSILLLVDNASAIN